MKIAPVSMRTLLIPLNSAMEKNALRQDSSAVESSDLGMNPSKRGYPPNIDICPTRPLSFVFCLLPQGMGCPVFFFLPIGGYALRRLNNTPRIGISTLLATSVGADTSR